MKMIHVVDSLLVFQVTQLAVWNVKPTVSYSWVPSAMCVIVLYVCDCICYILDIDVCLYTFVFLVRNQTLFSCSRLFSKVTRQHDFLVNICRCRIQSV